MSVFGLSFPYTQGESENAILNQLILTDTHDTTRINFQLEDVNYKRRCISVNVTDTKSQEISKKPLTYIDNVSHAKATPLLVRCDASFKRIKLKVSVKFNNEKKYIVIVKTKGDIDTVTKLKELLQSKDKSEHLDVSQISYRDLPLDEASQDYQKIIINDGFDSARINDDILNVFVFETDGSKYSHVFDFKVWINKRVGIYVDTKLPVPEPHPEPAPVPRELPNEYKEVKQNLYISDYRNAFNFLLLDGPDFRKVLNQYESCVPSIQKNISILIEELKSTENAMKKMTNSKNKIIDVINNLSHLNPILLRFKFQDEFKAKVDQLYTPLESSLSYFLNHVFNKKVLDKIKAVSTFDDEHNELGSFKKNFENNSKDYYNWLKKYLSNEKDKPESKLLKKRKAFELSKFDYLNYLNNFGKNQYVNELFEGLFKFTSVSIINNTSFETTAGLNDHYKIYLTVLLKFNAEKFKLRQMIEACKTNDELTELIKDNNLTTKPKSDINDNKTVTTDNLDLIFSPIETPKTPEFDNTSSEKSGILYALGGKGKQGWHKEWVVVKDGELKEFSDWRNGSELINKPIQIALSNVKLTSHDKRQNCFEITTSSGSKYVFQAINGSETNHWIKTLENSRHYTDKLDLKSKKVQSKPELNSRTKNYTTHNSHTTNSHPNKDFLKKVKSIPDSDNNICADCGSTENVEWISSNFLVSLCIKCSSCHRNMGSHVSKIKSLVLDNFEKESELLLGYINNRQHNSYLEETLKTKPNLLTHESKLSFINDKYINRIYTNKPEDLNDLLTKAVQKNDIPNTIKYISLGADSNLQLQIQLKDTKEPQSVSLFEYSLRKSVDGKYFVISEFLLINSTKINKVNKKLDLSTEAFEFWEKKYNKYCK